MFGRRLLVLCVVTMQTKDGLKAVDEAAAEDEAEEATPDVLD